MVTVNEHSFLEQRLPDTDRLATRPHERREALSQPVNHVAGDHRPPINAQVMFAVADHVRRVVLYNGSQYTTSVPNPLAWFLRSTLSILDSYFWEQHRNTHVE